MRGLRQLVPQERKATRPQPGGYPPHVGGSTRETDGDKSRASIVLFGLFLGFAVGGAEGIRTPDPHNAIVVLYQLSYDPIRKGSDTVEMGRPFVKNYLPAAAAPI